MSETVNLTVSGNYGANILYVVRFISEHSRLEIWVQKFHKSGFIKQVRAGYHVPVDVDSGDFLDEVLDEIFGKESLDHFVYDRYHFWAVLADTIEENIHKVVIGKGWIVLAK